MDNSIKIMQFMRLNYPHGCQAIMVCNFCLFDTRARELERRKTYKELGLLVEQGLLNKPFEGFYKPIEKPPMKTNKCITKFCKNLPKGKKGTCSTCNSREWRKDNPEKSAYNNLKMNAKRRNKVFDLTFAEFCKFCIKTDYIKKKGISRNCFHVDRIDESKGYTADNIQVLTNAENVRKYRTTFHSHYDDNKKEMYYNTATNPERTITPHPY